MSLNDLLYGELAEIADYIGGTEDDFTDTETKAILANLCRRVAALEKYRTEQGEALAERMGGDIEELKDRSDNFLMLTIRAHRFYHDVGAEGFVKVYPHLKRKIRRALKGEADAE